MAIGIEGNGNLMGRGTNAVVPTHGIGDAREIVPDPVRAVRSSRQEPSAKGKRGRVLIGVRDLGFLQAVLDHLDRDPRVEVVGALGEPELFVRSTKTAEPNVCVVCPSMARELRHPATAGALPGLLIVAEEMTVPVLRDAIDAGAVGVYAWPEERAELADVVAAARGGSAESQPARGTVIAVFGARGGSGTTFLASHLAASFADRGQTCVLVDLDLDFADVTVALGVGSNDDIRTLADLLPVLDELGPDHVEDALFRHPRGFSVLLAPREPIARTSVASGLYRAAIALLAGSFEVVVLHVPRTLDEVARSAIALADEVVLVVTLDLFSLYAARRSLSSLGLSGTDDRCRVVINPLLRSEIRLGDVERVLGARPTATVRFDRAVRRIQAQGQLLPTGRRRAARDVRALARQLSSVPTVAARTSSPAGA